jgi:hypothetical protein
MKGKELTNEHFAIDFMSGTSTQYSLQTDIHDMKKKKKKKKKKIVAGSSALDHYL